ncbi:unnamed protein product [Prorocentrum cordatum]|uniref:Uncharacterized protein n=1 Tax=Prorocentrum cordatum TaxID=2364126 RepID=A0ABN9WII6_9DINO|nr:unnamed protein product [Polarella glacialis]
MYKNTTNFKNGETLAALRGYFDGGRSVSGSAVGYWLQGLIVDPTTQASEWRTLQETGLLLEQDATAMESVRVYSGIAVVPDRPRVHCENVRGRRRDFNFEFMTIEVHGFYGGAPSAVIYSQLR